MTDTETQELIERLRRTDGCRPSNATCDEAAAALEATLWQPIADAPKDDTLVDLMYAGGRLTNARCVIPGKKWERHFNGLLLFTCYAPTHFKHITAPEG